MLLRQFRSSVSVYRITRSVARANRVHWSSVGALLAFRLFVFPCEGPKAACTCVRVETFLERPVMSHAIITSVLALPVAGCFLGAVAHHASASVVAIEETPP